MVLSSLRKVPAKRYWEVSLKVLAEALTTEIFFLGIDCTSSKYIIRAVTPLADPTFFPIALKWMIDWFENLNLFLLFRLPGPKLLFFNGLLISN